MTNSIKEKGGNLSDLFTTFIKFIDYFNHEKPGNDIVSFEFGSYLLSNVDYCLFANNNQHRKEIMPYLAKNFLIYSSDLLNMPPIKLNSILNNRLSLYGQLRKETRFGTDEFSKAHYEKYYSVISDIFLSSKGKSKIIEFNSINEVPLVIDFIGKHLLTVKIIEFELHMLKTFYEQIALVNLEN